MCKIKRRLIISKSVTFELEIVMTFFLFCITTSHYQVSASKHISSSLFVPLAFQLLTFYHNISIETKFWCTEQYTEMLAFYHEILTFDRK